LFFASDYVKTNTDLATMEGANEAARRAVNSLLVRDGSNAATCKVWKLEEPWLFSPLKWLDKKRLAKGEEYSSKIPWWMKIIMFAAGGVYALQYFAKVIWFLIVSKFETWIPDLNTTRSKFAFTAMAAAIGGLYYFSKHPAGYVTAAIWSYGMFAVYIIYWLISKDKIFKRLIAFAITAGIVELFSDAYLVSVTETLVYPPEGPMIWESPAYMPFSWAVVLIQIGYISWLVHGKLGPWKDGLLMVGFSAVLIPIYENFAIHAGWWSYENAKMIFGVPYYIYIAEGLLMFLVPYFLIKCLKRNIKYSIFYGVLEGIVMLIACAIAIFITTKLF